MSTPFTDREMDQQDRAAEKREQNWGKPAPIAPQIADLLNTVFAPQRAAEEPQEQQA